jgi:hypothetical protein
MRGPLEITLEKLRDEHRVPLGILSFDMEKEEIFLTLFPGLSTEEVNALLIKIGIKGIFE